MTLWKHNNHALRKLKFLSEDDKTQTWKCEYIAYGKFDEGKYIEFVPGNGLPVTRQFYKTKKKWNAKLRQIKNRGLDIKAIPCVSGGADMTSKLEYPHG